MILARSVLGCFAVAVLVSSCSAAETAKVENTTVSFAGVDKTPVLTEGKDFSVAEEVPSIIDGGRVTVFGWLDEHTAFASMPSAKTPSMDGSEPMRLVSVDTRTDRATTLADHGSDALPPYILDATSTRDFIVWTEIHDTSLESMRWDIYSLDRRNGKERHLASYKDLGAEKPPWPSIQGVTLQIVGDRVYYPVVEGSDAKADWSGAIYEVPLNGDAAGTKVIENATQAWADGQRLWFERDGKPGIWNASKQKESKVETAGVTRPCGMFARQGVLVQCDEDDSLVITEPSGKVTTIKGLSVRPTYLNATSRWVGFNSGDSTAFVYDLKRSRLTRVDNAMMKVDRHRGAELSVLKLDAAPNDDANTVMKLR